MKETLYLGIDAGATKTAAMLIDGNGRILSQCRDQGIALNGAPSAQQAQELQRIAQRLLSQAGATVGQLVCLGLGISGADDFPSDRALQHPALSKALDLEPSQLILANDGIAALWGTTNAPACAILQLGTASVGAWRSAPGKEQLFDSMGLAGLVDLRQGALQVAARMLQGLQAPSPLLESLLKFWGVTTELELTEGWFKGGISREQKANTTPLIFNAWLSGDVAAAALVESAAQDYALAAAVMARKTGAQAPVVCFGGGVLSRAPQAFHSLLSSLLLLRYPGAKINKPRLPAEAGACLMAAAAQGHDSSGLFAKLETAL